MKQLFALTLLFLNTLPTMHAQEQRNDHRKQPNTNLQVSTHSGIIEGVKESSGIMSFKGVPFAAPPTGMNRWKEPQPVKPWKGVKQTKQFGPRGMQPPLFDDMVFRSKGMSEDCLYLNVWTPGFKGSKPLPVLVYFYGGGFVTGDGSEGRYDGESMAQQGIVCLTVNYRLGIFGFFAHPELSKESPHHVSGNYALLDQTAALKWVQENIAAFGGDPTRVTIAGESAGSIAVSALMASPLSRNLISGAIGESGSLLGTLDAVPSAVAEKTGVEFAKQLGASSLADLRAIPADSLLSASVQFGPFKFAMNVDGYVFPKSPNEIYASGQQARVPLLAGWNSEESGYNAIMNNQALNVKNYQASVEKLFGAQAGEVLKVYNAASDEQVQQVATDLASDKFIGFSTWKWTDIHSQTGGKPVYRYYFEQPRPAIDLHSPKGAVHSAEIEYAMGNLHYNKVYSWTKEDMSVSKTMQHYFSNFIKAGNPNGQGLPGWTPITPNQPAQVMHINARSSLKTERHRDRYLTLDKLAGNEK